MTLNQALAERILDAPRARPELTRSETNVATATPLRDDERALDLRSFDEREFYQVLSSGVVLAFPRLSVLLRHGSSSDGLELRS